MLHLVLMIYFGFSATDGVSYNPHGLRHILVTAGQQLKHYGIVAEEDLDLLGHWARGSSMPRSYDASAGVSEMQVRSALLTQIRRGWWPSAEGCLPAEPIGNGASGQLRIRGQEQHINMMGALGHCAEYGRAVLLRALPATLTFRTFQLRGRNVRNAVRPWDSQCVQWENAIPAVLAGPLMSQSVLLRPRRKRM